ncbi:MBL fold metallo-hydrolase [Oceanivirga miroungae]|uniref:Beta-lactamase n=1 Tax=Oceanivirga miroungae TaxID=1130046 RepID=A0A6I8M6A3_9FUSO|nr:MBL fold metallo-hydrolase [Oceanivirga miroungae]VWL85419.1 beta-lactamase [Oceanivirga miroungae]
MEYKIVISETLDENTYILHNDKKECLVIDPGNEVAIEVIDYIESNNLDFKAIFITHGHFDHILGIEKLEEYKKVPIYMGKEDIDFLYNSYYSLSKKWLNIDYKLSENYDIIGVNDNEEIFGLTCIKTPGHTKGSICYIDSIEKNIFTGDTMFRMTYGRTDFPSGDYIEMLSSLKRLLTYDDYYVFPGHGPSTTIEKEKKTYFGMI